MAEIESERRDPLIRPEYKCPRLPGLCIGRCDICGTAAFPEASGGSLRWTCANRNCGRSQDHAISGPIAPAEREAA